jgi:HlyD family secretion protein
MESVTFVSEVDIQKVKVGQRAEIGIDAAPDKRLTGTVTSVANIGEQRPNSDSKVFEVILLVDGTDWDLRPAMTTSNTIIVAQAEDVLYVPLEAIYSSDSLTYVYMKGSRAKVKQEVLLGLINENAAVIEKGLAPTDDVYLSVPENADEFVFSYL